MKPKVVGVRFVLGPVLVLMLLVGCNHEERETARVPSAAAEATNVLKQAPEGFLSLQVAIRLSHGSASPLGYSLRQFTKLLTGAGSSVVWEEDAPESWIMRVNSHDRATGRTNAITFVFSRQKDLSVLTRYIDNGRELNQQAFTNTINLQMVQFGDMILQAKIPK
jgi:hypothetical protein